MTGLRESEDGHRKIRTMRDFKRQFVTKLPPKIKRKLDKKWIVQEQKPAQEQEEIEVDLMQNPTGKEQKVQERKRANFHRSSNNTQEGRPKLQMQARPQTTV